MPLIDWREEFALGIPGVDHEHRELIALINRIHDEAQGAGDVSAIVGFLGELHAQISAHFALEEKLMRERHYSGYPSHKDDHERLLEEIHEMMERYEAGEFVDMDGFHVKPADPEKHADLVRRQDAAAKVLRSLCIV